jgi:carbonic anhydrase
MPLEKVQRPENLSVDEALARLRDGNQRFVSGEFHHKHSFAERRLELVNHQHPFATVVACSDSRVSPELLFDQSIGDLFVIRVAGNVVDDVVLGSIEYACLHLGVNLVVVMGHQGCGAVKAAVDNVDIDGPTTHSHLDSIIEAIRPAVRRAREEHPEDMVGASVRENARGAADHIRQSPPIMSELGQQGVAVRSSYYDMESGKVEW